MIDIDKLIIGFDNALRTLLSSPQTLRPVPGDNLPETELMTDAEKSKSAAMMRVNHTGEICAQALYQGQAFTARNKEVQAVLAQAAYEETDHLAWTEQRITELNGRKSLLNPLWYSGSFAIGLVVGMVGDKWNLGFLAETENQVEIHLTEHLDQLSHHDKRSRAIVTQMQTDEASHAAMAESHGGVKLPMPIQLAMKLGSRVMTRTAYWI